MKFVSGEGRYALGKRLHAGKTQRPSLRRELLQAVWSQNQGVSLLEVILAVSVLTVGLLSVGYLQTSAIRLNAQARGITEASVLAGAKMDHLMSFAYHQIKTTPATNENGYLIGWTAADDPANQVRRITVTASWSGLGTFGKTRQIAIESIKAYGDVD